MDNRPGCLGRFLDWRFWAGCLTGSRIISVLGVGLPVRAAAAAYFAADLPGPGMFHPGRYGLDPAGTVLTSDYLTLFTKKSQNKANGRANALPFALFW